ncbi:LOW QUALITY PROTEIN: Terpene_synth_C domain-containing protein [Cephalotus follicularis]|uniref:Terpene_synth_C domain-containing protein n=2 Tax=Cephalotus follicularis TaxID=3775 RepID=A0A1Q3DHY4_CEPFO|nr:LOW QUALITY PROTEIN: Terpene_synth_C domain-containing protein [Cephalotus follicularis]
MKFLCGIISNLFDEWERESTKEGRAYSVYYTRETMKELARAYIWFNRGYMPPVDEYLSNALMSSAHLVMIATCFIGMGEIARIKEYKWLMQPKLLRATEALAGFINDQTSQMGNLNPNPKLFIITCIGPNLTKLHKSPVNRIQDTNPTSAWKDTIVECMKPTSVSTHLIMRLLNYTHVNNLVYKHDDGYSTSKKSLNVHISSLFIDRIPI